MSECHGGTKPKDSSGTGRKYINIFLSPRSSRVKVVMRNVSTWEISLPAKTDIGQIIAANTVPPILHQSMHNH